MENLKDVIESKLNTLGDAIDAKINAATEAQKTNLKGELDSLKQSEIAKLTGDYAEMQKQLNAIDVKTNRITGGMDARKSFGETLTEKLKSDAMFKAFKERNSKSAVIDLAGFPLFTKAAGDMTTGNSFTGEVVPPTRVPGIVVDPERPTHVRDFIATATTDSNTVYYVRETAFEDNTATRAEGIAKPQSDFELEQLEAPVRKIATFVRMSTEMLNDTPGLVGYLSARLPKKLRLEEDAQILYGNGNAPNLEGITEVATAYVDTLADADVNRFDVLVKAISQARVAEYNPNYIMINTADWYNMLLTKDNEGGYIFPESARFGGVAPRIAGVPIVATTAITAGDFLVGDFAQGVQLFDRLQANIRFFEQDADNATKNLVTVVAEERLALPIYRPTAFIYGNFATALAQGSA
jgi:HK97 family phage major capsid protein